MMLFYFSVVNFIATGFSVSKFELFPNFWALPKSWKSEMIGTGGLGQWLGAGFTVTSSPCPFISKPPSVPAPSPWCKTIRIPIHVVPALPLLICESSLNLFSY